MEKTYPPELEEYIRQRYNYVMDKVLAEECNNLFGISVTESWVKNYRKRNKLIRDLSKLSEIEKEKYYNHYPSGFYEFVRDNSKNVTAGNMAKMANEKFGTSFTAEAIKCYRQKHGIVSGLNGWFVKGKPSINKGKKQSEFMSPEAIEKCKKTRFKKGIIPANQLPVGSIVTGTQGYKLIKISMKGTLRERWKLLQRYVWEQNYGEIPENMNVAFKDSNPNNCDIENLMLISKSENMILSQRKYRFADAKLTETAVNLVRFEKAIEEKRIKLEGKTE